MRALLGAAFELEIESTTPRFGPSGGAYWELFSTSYGPTKALAESLGDRREELHRDWVELDENYAPDGEIAPARVPARARDAALSGDGNPFARRSRSSSRS